MLLASLFSGGTPFPALCFEDFTEQSPKDLFCVGPFHSLISVISEQLFGGSLLCCHDDTLKDRDNLIVKTFKSIPSPVRWPYLFNFIFTTVTAPP